MPSTNIVIGVVNRVATPPSDAVIVCGNSDYTLTFNFDSEWSAEATKIARFVWFSRNKTFSEEVDFEGNVVNVPILSNTNAVYVGVYAGNLRTTTPAKIVCEPSILCYGQDANASPGDMALIKGQIAELVKALKNISVDPEKIKKAVTEYLVHNPVKESDPTVPEWAKQPQKPKYTAKEIGAVASSELNSAVNDALDKAKASGEFNGRNGNDYVLTEDDKTEIAEMVEVPEIRIYDTIKSYPNGDVKYGLTIEGPNIVNEDGTYISNSATVWDGKDGKSAYAYAKEAGYTGTEEEFAQKLAREDSGGNVDFKVGETLKLENGVLSVNTTNDMEQDNTLPITSAGVFATVGNIEALLKTI